MTISQAVRKRILELCKQKNFSINALAVSSGMTQSTLNDIVNGTTKNTGIVTIRKICTGLEIEVKDFFNTPYFVGLDIELD